MRCRKDVKDLTAAEKTAFVNAVHAVKAKPSVLHPTDPNLSRYDDYPEIHMNAMMASIGWAHNRPSFFPWHRVLLLEFENDLQAIDPSLRSSTPRPTCSSQRRGTSHSGSRPSRRWPAARPSSARTSGGSSSRSGTARPAT